MPKTDKEVQSMLIETIFAMKKAEKNHLDLLRKELHDKIQYELGTSTKIHNVVHILIDEVFSVHGLGEQDIHKQSRDKVIPDGVNPSLVSVAPEISSKPDSVPNKLIRELDSRVKEVEDDKFMTSEQLKEKLFPSKPIITGCIGNTVNFVPENFIENFIDSKSSHCYYCKEDTVTLKDKCVVCGKQKVTEYISKPNNIVMKGKEGNVYHLDKED